MLTATIILALLALVCGILGITRRSVLHTALGVILLAICIIVSVLPK